MACILVGVTPHCLLRVVPIRTLSAALAPHRETPCLSPQFSTTRLFAPLCPSTVPFAPSAPAECYDWYYDYPATELFPDYSEWFAFLKQHKIRHISAGAGTHFLLFIVPSIYTATMSETLSLRGTLRGHGDCREATPRDQEHQGEQEGRRPRRAGP